MHKLLARHNAELETRFALSGIVECDRTRGLGAKMLGYTHVSYDTVDRRSGAPENRFTTALTVKIKESC